MPVVAVLADGQRPVPWRRLRPLLRLRADQDRVRHRSLCHGGETPARRSRPAAGSSRSIWPDPTIRLPISPSGPGMAAWRRACSTARANSCRCRTTPMSSAGPTRSASAPPCSEAARSTAPGANLQINCTNAMTPAISKPRPRTRSGMSKLRPAPEFGRFFRRQTYSLSHSHRQRVAKSEDDAFSPDQNWLYCSITAPKSGKRRMKLRDSKKPIRQNIMIASRLGFVITETSRDRARSIL